MWAQAFGDSYPTTKRLAELKAEDGDLAGAVSTWKVSDAVWDNLAGLRHEYLNTLDDIDRMMEDDGPEEWGSIEAQYLTLLLAERGDEAALAQLRAQADSGDSEAALQLARCEELLRVRKNSAAQPQAPPEE